MPSSPTLTARCLCKAHVFTTTISHSDLPLSALTCHCNSCRHVTGALYSSCLPWPTSSRPDLSALRCYDFSPRLQIFFCGTCSTPMFWGMKERETVTVFTGTLENITVGGDGMLVKFEGHEFVEDTIDGGMSEWMCKPNVDGSIAKRFKGRPEGEEIPLVWPEGNIAITDVDAVPIRCHCKGVDFVLKKGDYEGKPKEELPWYIDQTTKKYLAWFDVCDSCRLASGVDLFVWTRAELKDITPSSTATFATAANELKSLVDNNGPSIGTLAYYASSPEVQRYFCSRCSACVFYVVNDEPNVVDVAVGLIEGIGARAEQILTWKLGKMVWAEDVKGGWREGLVESVHRDFTGWRTERKRLETNKEDTAL